MNTYQSIRAAALELAIKATNGLSFPAREEVILQIASKFERYINSGHTETVTKTVTTQLLFENDDNVS